MDFQIIVSAGELADRMTICLIKSKNIADPVKSDKYFQEYLVYRDMLQDVSHKIGKELKELEDVNFSLWKVEDSIRDAMRSLKVKNNVINEVMVVGYSGKIIQLNGRRVELKNTISKILSSSTETKVYGGKIC